MAFLGLSAVILQALCRASWTLPASPASQLLQAACLSLPIAHLALTLWEQAPKAAEHQTTSQTAEPELKSERGTSVGFDGSGTVSQSSSEPDSNRPLRRNSVSAETGGNVNLSVNKLLMKQHHHIEMLQTQLKQAETHEARVRELQDQVQEQHQLRERLKTLQAKFDKLTTRATSLEDANDGLRRDNAQLRQRQQQLTEELSEAQEQLGSPRQTASPKPDLDAAEEASSAANATGPTELNPAASAGTPDPTLEGPVTPTTKRDNVDRLKARLNKKYQELEQISHQLQATRNKLERAEQRQQQTEYEHRYLLQAHADLQLQLTQHSMLIAELKDSLLEEQGERQQLEMQLAHMELHYTQASEEDSLLSMVFDSVGELETQPLYGELEPDTDSLFAPATASRLPYPEDDAWKPF
ncbi:uncharacterized protein MONBRDRAFT_29349 [Monosiga brevicollis MX1]|uniref:Uncharacterized protein n=1 Tax=Monosiga brevicollis TaxID=81824 RepID=A9VAU6_MONBE|nr:uncharacterized protein MONBRDRAFT_29349 [Monosiga brevicollis MX1]EDQ85437.1 predicted protein [Monosiga brevicollis MX1]|eukprot:XP_001749848.1 hypothetical protein [Monosiga brevicollis MX1]